jgi:uncharacterized protein (DUF2062 family)
VTGGQERMVDTPKLDFSFSNMDRWISMLVEWMAAMGKPFALGLFLLALGLAVTGYLTVLGIWRIYVASAWRRRGRTRSQPFGR